VHASQWLSSLETFTGAFYRRCPDVECRGIIRFLVQRLTEGHVLELGVLRTLLKSAGGYGFADYGPVASLATGQLEGRAGSQLLKRETFAFGVVERFNPRAASRLRSVLQSDNMGITILILLAQIRGKTVFGGSGTRPKPVKQIGNLYDTVRAKP
jgi:THO complex subunit 2